MGAVHDDNLSNCGRWGADDQRGSLNLLTPELVKKAAGLMKTGKVYSLSMPDERLADGRAGGIQNCQTIGRLDQGKRGVRVEAPAEMKAIS